MFPQLNVTADAADTVKRFVQVCVPVLEVCPPHVTVCPQVLFVLYVQVTSIYPPVQANGAADGALFVNVPELHPPLTVVEAKNEAQAAFTSACVLHDGTVTLFPQLSVAAGAAVTVKRFVHVCVPLVEVCPPHVTV